jgi:hypothetical protein
MPQQKRKASAIASAKIAEEAGSGRKRKSDTKEQQNPSVKEKNSDNVKSDEIEQNVSDDKKVESVQEQPDIKRRKKSEELQLNAQEIHAAEDDNGIITENNDQMLVDNVEQNPNPNIDQSKSEQAATEPSDQNQVQIETRKELEKKMAPNVLEKGHICFLYRPKIDVEEPSSVEEVQRMYMLLIPYMVRPSVSEEPVPSYFHQVIDNKQFKSDEPIPGKTRVILFGKKRLPEIEKHAKFWAYVDKAFTNMDDLKEFTSGKKYQTATRGERELSTCKLMGRGVYNIVEHKGHTHLAYVLEFPEKPGEVQKDFNVKHEGSYVISVKNPETTNPQNMGLSGNEKVTYPTHLLDKFGGRRFISLVSPEFLDYDGAELLFIGAKEDIAGELGEAGSELEELADFEIKKIAPLSTERVIYEELHLEKDVLPSEPLHGLWK